VNGFHKEIRIVATSVVETDRPNRQPEHFSDTWPIPPESLDYSLYDFLHFGGPVVDSAPLRELSKTLGAWEGMPLGELSMRILNQIDEKFTYKKGITNAASPITEILQTGYGVCQDFTHLMIGLARVLHIPARYVSGLLHPGERELRGNTQTHAWAELYFPSTGWIGFDAANRCLVGANFIKVASGRDFRDVPPNRGVYRGNATETIEVAVTSDELPAIPPELAAERLQSLDVPTYPPGYTGHRETANQQEHQQQ
jgi:transglutaminase-like putative cysteine protease